MSLLNMNMIGEALAARAATFADFESLLLDCSPAKLKEYLEHKFPRFRKISFAHVESALRAIRALRQEEREAYYFEWQTNARCDNEPSARD